MPIEMRIPKIVGIFRKRGSMAKRPEDEKIDAVGDKNPTTFLTSLYIVLFLNRIPMIQWAGVQHPGCVLRSQGVQ